MSTAGQVPGRGRARTVPAGGAMVPAGRAMVPAGRAR